MFIPFRTDVRTYFRNVLHDVSSHVHISRRLVVVKRCTTVRNQVARGGACSFFPTAWDGMLDQTMIWGRLQCSLQILQIGSVIGRFGGKNFIGALLSKPWFEVTSNTLFRYAWYRASCEYGAVNDAVGACKFTKAPNVKPLAADVVALEAPWKFLDPENPKILSRSGLSWLRACGPAMRSTTWFVGAEKKPRRGIKMDAKFLIWNFCWNIKYFICIWIQLAWNVGPGHKRYYGRIEFIFIWFRSFAFPRLWRPKFQRIK